MDVFDLAATITLNTSNYTNGLNSASNTTNNFQNKLSNGLKAAAVAGGAAIGSVATAVSAFAKTSVDVGKQFDSSMSQLAATMGMTNSEMNSTQVQTESFSGTLRDFAELMGKETAFSASQAADGLNVLAMAGYDATQQVTALPAVLNLAASGGLELADAAGYATGIINGFNMKVDDTAHVSDVLATMASSASGSVATFGAGMQAVAGMATTTGQNIDDMAVALEILGNNSVEGAEGGNALARALKNLYQPTATGAEGLASLGISAYDASGNARPLKDVLLDLNNATKDMSAEAQNQALAKIFDSATLKSVPFLINNVTTSWDSLAAGIAGADGAAQKMADVQLDNLEGDITKFHSALEGVQISLSNALTPALRTFVQAAMEGIQNLDMNAISAAISNVITGLANLMSSLDIEGAINVVSAAISFLTNNFDILVPIIAGATAAMIAYKAATTISNIINALTAATQGQTVAQTLLNAVMNANPFVLVATLIAGLVVAVITLWNTNEGFRNAVTHAWEAVKSGISAAGEAIKGVFSSIGNAVSNLKSHAAAGFNAILSAFRNIGSNFKNIGSNIVHGIWNGIKAGWSWLTDKVHSLVSGLVDGVKNVLGIHSPSRVFARIGKFMTAGLEEGWVDSYDDVKDTITGGLDFTDTSATMRNMPVTDLPVASSTGQGDTYIPIYLGNELLDTVLVKAGSRVDYRSGGRVNV